MNSFKITKSTKYKTEQMELVIGILCLISGKKLSKTNTRVLAHYVVYGIKESTDNLLISSGVIGPDPLANSKVLLTKLGFLKRTKELYNSYELNLSKDFDKNQPIIKLIIEIDNS